MHGSRPPPFPPRHTHTFSPNTLKHLGSAVWNGHQSRCNRAALSANLGICATAGKPCKLSPERQCHLLHIYLLLNCFTCCLELPDRLLKLCQTYAKCIFTMKGGPVGQSGCRRTTGGTSVGKDLQLSTRRQGDANDTIAAVFNMPGSRRLAPTLSGMSGISGNSNTFSERYCCPCTLWVRKQSIDTL